MKCVTYAMIILTCIRRLTAAVVQINTVTYTTTPTTIDCPITQALTLPTWSGPPGDTAYTERKYPDIYHKTDRLSYASNERSLILNDTQIADAGTYKCIKNIDGVVEEGWNIVTVRIRPNDPIISSTSAIKGRQSILGTEGVSQTLACTSTGGYPAPTVVWYRGTTELNRTSSGSLDGTTYTVVLTHRITPTRTDDRQSFICQSYYPSSEVGSQDLKTNTAELYLNLKPATPTISTVGSPVSGETSQTIVRCVTSGFRPATSINMTMSFRGVTHAYTTAVEDTNTETYSITADYNRAVQKADNGQLLTCSVTHQTLQTPISQPMAIVVKFAPVSASLTGNTSIVADSINKMYLTCTSGTSNPASSIVWKRQNINITSNGQLQLSPGNYGGQITTQILEMTPTRDMYGHNVTCEAENGINGQSAAIDHIKIEIRYNPQLMTRSQPSDLKEGVSSVTLTCTVSSKPESTIKWYKDGNTKPIKTVSSASRNNALAYTIQHVQRSHAGGYTCSANNNIGGDVTNKVQVVVQSFPIITEPVVPNGQYHKVSTRLDVYSPTTISVQYYNNGDTPNVNCYKLYDNTRQVSNIYTISSKSVVVQLPVFTQTVNTEGTMTTVTMAITQTSQLGFYVIVIKNNIGEGIVPVQIVSEGFNGGLVQTFKIEYKGNIDEYWTVKIVQEPTTNITLDGLSAGTIYEVRISAYNAIGTSSTTEVEAFKTAVSEMQVHVQPHTQANNTALLVGTFVGGIAVTVIVIAAIMIFRRQRKLGKCTCLNTSNKNVQHVEDVPKDQHVYYNVSSTVVATDDIILNETDCDTGTTIYESTISSNPKEHVYTDIEAHPQGVTNSQKGMEMYENLKTKTSR